MRSKADPHLNTALTGLTTLRRQITAAENAGLTPEETDALTEASLKATLAALDRAFDAMLAEEGTQ
jgi:hypothetical protein